MMLRILARGAAAYSFALRTSRPSGGLAAGLSVQRGGRLEEVVDLHAAYAHFKDWTPGSVGEGTAGRDGRWYAPALSDPPRPLDRVRDGCPRPL